MDVVDKGMAHMMADGAHKDHMMNLSNTTGESKEQWFERMQKEFDARPEDK